MIHSITYVLFILLATSGGQYSCSRGIPQIELWDSQDASVDALCRCPLPPDENCKLDNVQAHYVYANLPRITAAYQLPIPTADFPHCPFPYKPLDYARCKLPENMIANCSSMYTDASGICGYLISCPDGCLKDTENNRCVPIKESSICGFPYIQKPTRGGLCPPGWMLSAVRSKIKLLTFCLPNWYVQ